MKFYTVIKNLFNISLQSSSFHKINGDKPLSRFESKIYFKLNRWINKHSQKSGDSDLKIKYFNQFRLEQLEVGTRSPSRYLSDLFWININWEDLENKLGSIHLFDLGCGKGQYLPFWAKCSNNRISSYLGLDIQRREQWEGLSQKFTFAQFKDSPASSFDPNDMIKSNVIFSQSVLEHIEDDLLFFKLVAQQKVLDKKPWVQIHLVPPSFGLEKWRLHGVRQYSPKTLSRISKLFLQSQKYAFFMGGEHSNRAHIDYITRPIMLENKGDLRESLNQEYQQAVNRAVVEDQVEGLNQEPSFWALVLVYNCDWTPFNEPIESLTKFVKPGFLCLDLGANVGNISQQMVEAGAEVYAFEPNPYAFGRLKERFADNANVHCIQKAVLDEETTIPLYFHEHSDEDEVKWSVGSSLLDFKGNVLKNKAHAVDSVDLSAFILGLPRRVDLIKMDVEGVECRLINHLIDTSAIDRVGLILAETHDHKIPELKEETDALRRRIVELGLGGKINLNWV